MKKNALPINLAFLIILAGLTFNCAGRNQTGSIPDTNSESAIEPVEYSGMREEGPTGQRYDASGVNGQEWPNYLGPFGNSTSSQQGILRTWPANGPEVLWTTELGRGNGGPVARDGKVYLLDRDDQTGDFMRCFDLTTGEQLWSYSYDAPGSVRFPGSRSVPALDGNYIYSCGHNGDLYCIDINTHQPVWSKNIWTDFGGGEIPTWAITQNPLIYGDLVIVASQAPQAGVVAYDKLTGNMRWKTPSLGGTGYVSPAIVNISGEDHVVMISASSRGGRGREGSGGGVTGMSPQSGEILWKYDNFQCIIPIPSAYDAGEGKVLILGGYEAGTVMIRITKETGGGYAVEELFRNPDFGAHTQPPVFFNGYYYAQYTTNERRDGLVCMSMDGNVMWKTGNAPAFNKGGMILADGMILATDGEKTLYLIEPDPSAFKPVASADLLDIASGLSDARYGNQNWAPIALADGKLLIRDQGRLMCIRVTQ